MSDDVWRREPIESPCVKLCVLCPDTGFCLGCHRTGAEIAAWTRMSAAERQTLMAALPDRAKLVQPKRRGGRAGRLSRLD
ncbi:MAG: DUF1289 domain-containing protein [Pseudomonadota bacterium]